MVVGWVAGCWMSWLVLLVQDGDRAVYTGDLFEEAEHDCR